MKKQNDLFRYSLLLLLANYCFLISTQAQNIVKAEYFLDTDPGFGLATNVPLTPAANITNLSFNIPISTLPPGFHTLFTRTKDANGRWSITNHKTFFKESIATTLPNVVKVEYFIDTDPGFGSGTNVPVTPATNITNLAFTVNLSSLQPGFHTIFTRAKDSNGKWSITNHQTFYKESLPTSLSNIVKVEYYIDTDPGFGSGTNVPVTPATDIANLTFNVNLTSLQPGFHNIYTRAKDANGKWSTTNVRTFYKEVVPVSLPNIVKAEYFIDNDPGFGSGTNIPLTASTDVANLQFNVNISALPVGSHNLYVRAKDANGKWSLTNVKAFNVCNGPAAPTVTAASRCDVGTVTLTATGGTAGNYRWYANATDITPISGATAATFTTPSLSTTATYYVAIVNGSCESPRIPVTATINAKPNAPTVTSTVSYCQGSAATALSATGTGLLWYTSATGGTGSATAPTPTTTTAGTTIYYVTQTVNGCESNRSAISVQITAKPALPTVTSTVSYCQGSTSSALTATGSGLKWYTTATGGTGSATAPTPSTITPGTTTYYVSQTVNTCEGPRAAIAVQVNATPAKPTISVSGQTLTSSSATGNQWQLNGVDIPGATGQTYTQTQSGSYTVVVTVNGCSNTSSALVITGISKALAAKERSMLLYPNPNQGKFQLELNNFKTAVAVLTVTDLAGKTILTKEVKGSNGNISETIALKAAQGIYLLRIKADDQTIIRKVVVE